VRFPASPGHRPADVLVGESPRSTSTCVPWANRCSHLRRFLGVGDFSRRAGKSCARFAARYAKECAWG